MRTRFSKRIASRPPDRMTQPREHLSFCNIMCLTTIKSVLHLFNFLAPGINSK